MARNNSFIPVSVSDARGALAGETAPKESIMSAIVNASPAIVPAVVPAVASPARNASMAAIRAAMPEYFNADIAGLVAALSRPEARIEALSYALAGAALERAQSGNLPKAWASVDTVAQSLKGQTKTRVSNALALILAIKPASVKGEVAAYEVFAVETLASIAYALTPAASTKDKAPAVNWKAECLTARAALEVALSELDAVKKALIAAKQSKAPAVHA